MLHECWDHHSISYTRGSRFPRLWHFPGGASGKESTCQLQETQVQSLGQENLLEKEIATHSSIRAWKIPWTEKPGRLQSMGSQRVGHDFTFLSFILQKRKPRTSSEPKDIHPPVSPTHLCPPPTIWTHADPSQGSLRVEISANSRKASRLGQPLRVALSQAQTSRQECRPLERGRARGHTSLE